MEDLHPAAEIIAAPSSDDTSALPS
jgi:hypothetical protein